MSFGPTATKHQQRRHGPRMRTAAAAAVVGKLIVRLQLPPDYAIGAQRDSSVKYNSYVVPSRVARPYINIDYQAWRACKALLFFVADTRWHRVDGQFSSALGRALFCVEVL